MKQPEHSQSISLTGEIVETFARDGQERVRIALHPCCIEAVPGAADDPHLRDTVAIEARLTITQMRLLPGTEAPRVTPQGERLS
jgi:hypothetical protein